MKKQNNIIRDPTEMETNIVIQQVLDNYGYYMDDIDALLSIGYPKDKTIKLVTKRYKDFIVN